MERFDVVVVGSGALGASAAYHLTRLGQHVALVDKAEIASQTSPRAAGLSGQLRRNPVMTQLAVRSVQKIREFQEETGEPLVYFAPGSMNVARTAKHVLQLEKAVAYGKSLGLDIESITPEQGAERMPFLKTKGVLAMTHMHSDVYLEPSQLPLGYARASEKLGASLMPNTTVSGLGVEHGRITHVDTDRGEILTTTVVDAAGAWLRLVTNAVNFDAPIQPIRHQLMITVPLPGVATTQPIVRIIDVNVYVRPERGGLMLGGYEADPLIYPRDLPACFKIDALQLDLGVLRRLADSVFDQFPIFRGIELQEHRGGLPTMTPDGEHVVGPVPDIEGLYVMGGCNVGGLSISPALGEEIAQWVVSGAPSVDLSRMSPGRFTTHRSADEIILACTTRYAHYYSPPPSSPTGY